MTHKVHENGWIELDIPEEFEVKAKSTRQERDLQYGNIYVEKKTDERWVGELGEKAFDSWMRELRVDDFKWILRDVAGKEDFTIKQKRIDIKTVKRAGPPRDGYTAQVTTSHMTDHVDELFFMSYDITQRKMWFLGGISMKGFTVLSKHYKAGEKVHPYYTVRKGHEINNIELDKLLSPKAWINYMGLRA